jgi:hypothetical protein
MSASGPRERSGLIIGLDGYLKAVGILQALA